MKPINMLTLLAASMAFMGQLHAADISIPETFDAIDTSSGEAYGFVKKCVPTTSESEFNRIVRELKDNAVTTIRPLNQTAPYMSITKEKVYCVQVSAHKYPILPLSAFDQTINFPEMDADERHKLLIDLSQQIANYGYASAFIKNDTGNGFEVVYLLASDRPLRMYFHPNFVKSDEIADRHFSNIYKTAGSMSVTSHGPVGNSENFKLFFGR